MAEKQEIINEKFSRFGIESGSANSPAQLSELISTRDEILLPFLTGLDRDEQDHAEEWARQISDQGGRLEPVTVITPIAAHQESAQTVYHALSEYGRQRDCERFSLLLGLNMPDEHKDSPNIDNVVAAIDKAADDFPSLDIRIVHETYDHPTIGRVRRDLWNAVAWQSYEQTANGKLTETIGISHDIDLVRLSPHFIAAVQSHYASKIAMLAYAGSFWEDVELDPVRTRGKHAYDDSLPNASRAVMYIDTMNRMSGYGYEAGSVYPISYYAGRGGIDPSAKTYEIAGLTDPHAKRPFMLQSDRLGRWAVWSETSMRRYAARLHDVPIAKTWTADSFGANDPCRITEPTDITVERLQQVISENVPSDMNGLVFGGPDLVVRLPSPYTAEKNAERLRQTARRRLRLAERALRSIAGMPGVAEWAAEYYAAMPDLIHDSVVTNAKIYETTNKATVPASTLRKPPDTVGLIDS